MWNRREVLRVGGLSALGLSLPGFLRARAAQAQQPTLGLSVDQQGARDSFASKADACIVIYLNGGPSHLDMWDMKPDGPVDIRGEFSPIGSSVPGLQVSEHLPRMARSMHRTTLIRSMQHSVNNSHAAAVYAALTGHDRGEQGGGAMPTDHPAPGSVLAKLRPPRGAVLPYVALPYKTQEGAGGPLQPGFLAGFLGANHDPFWILDDPSRPEFQVRNFSLPDGLSTDRMAQRKGLLSGLDRGLSERADRGLSALDAFQSRAFDLLTTDTVQRAFRLESEADDVRERYGRNIYGQSVLLARRLVESGTRFVTMSWAPDANATWDTHGNNFASLKNTLLPQFDAACSSLLEDLEERGMLERTLVAVLGDFGRTPKINTAAGRDHWNACYSILLAGGGVKQGAVIGASDRSGAVPLENPISPGDVIATMYRLLGIDPLTVIYDSLERPMSVVPNGRVLHEIIA